MAKSLLILMLMTTQLLAGSGGSVYLCISNDGEYCCLDTGPRSCTCCQEHQQEAAHETCCSDAGCTEGIAEPSCGHHDETSPCPEQNRVVKDDACGCTHIPVAASAGHPTTVTRPTVTVDSERLALLVAWLPTWLSGTDAASFLPHFRWTGPPAVPDFTLTVISTVVIRC
ncbi:hypothetical protein SH668x_003665 [Planctomicrobium sp. SH668]|jgi:hypothetical protein|uniref:hypothetical protein n=1 Tax=Planctomicrobium sp. SH668 TaxID=3448126 RepID=UPI003F5BB143